MPRARAVAARYRLAPRATIVQRAREDLDTVAAKQNQTVRQESKTKAAAKPSDQKRGARARRARPPLEQDAPSDARADARADERESAPTVAAAPARKGRGKPPFDPSSALLEAWSTHERIQQFLLEQLDAQAWGAFAPIGKGRTIRGVVAHMHNVRLLWLASHAPDDAALARLDRETATLDEARKALAASALALTKMLRHALADNGKLPGFKPDAVHFLAYAMAHEAHHRGQICLLARAVGRPLASAAGFGLWEWRKRHGEAHPEPAD
ncbi:MAG: hypothetical protein FJ298_08665 [Planctomycetes bacterium]|nr:hypothetical protein [Planctomycetota bacterium]